MLKHQSGSHVNSDLVNRPEAKLFLRSALAWKGSVTPIVLPRVAVAAVYALGVYLLSKGGMGFALPITPFEYSGIVLGLLLVLRVNAGHDRWWEARKIWGTIVNQSRNLALIINGYTSKNDESALLALRWVAACPYVIRESLRNERVLKEVSEILGATEMEAIKQTEHMPTYVAYRITHFLNILQRNGMTEFAFLRADTEKSQLVDAVGACERILNTRMPFVLAIKTRRFIFLFLLLLPFALLDRAGWFTPLVVALTSYPLFSLDEIGAELQNPFSKNNLSHLPLDDICKTIANNVLNLPFLK